MRKIFDIVTWSATFFIALLYGYHFLSWPGVMIVISILFACVYILRSNPRHA